MEHTPTYLPESHDIFRWALAALLEKDYAPSGPGERYDFVFDLTAFKRNLSPKAEISVSRDYEGHVHIQYDPARESTGGRR